MQILRRHVLRKGDFKSLKEQLSKIIEGPIDLLFKEGAELVLTDSGELYAEDKKVLAFKVGEIIIPSLRALNEGLVKLPTITVDMGAVPYVTNGADIMAPGITKVTNGLVVGDIVTIIDENYGKALAVGKLLIISDNIKQTEKGKVIKNLHYVNDSIWSLEL
ncbi:MAG: PUA domain-containing protein [Candidatus Heimdallarchaeota archaeon]